MRNLGALITHSHVMQSSPRQLSPGNISSKSARLALVFNPLHFSYRFNPSMVCSSTYFPFNLAPGTSSGHGFTTGNVLVEAMSDCAIHTLCVWHPGSWLGVNKNKGIWRVLRSAITAKLFCTNAKARAKKLSLTTSCKCPTYAAQRVKLMQDCCPRRQ